MDKENIEPEKIQMISHPTSFNENVSYTLTTTEDKPKKKRAPKKAAGKKVDKPAGKRAKKKNA
jgi:hypothetical protein